VTHSVLKETDIHFQYGSFNLFLNVLLTRIFHKKKKKKKVEEFCFLNNNNLNWLHPENYSAVEWNFNLQQLGSHISPLCCFQSLQQQNYNQWHSADMFTEDWTM
jgi:hypothetical protein